MGLERDLEPPVGEEQARRLELRPNVADGLRVGGVAELLVDLVAVRLDERAEPRRTREPRDELDGDGILRSAVADLEREPLDRSDRATVTQPRTGRSPGLAPVSKPARLRSTISSLAVSETRNQPGTSTTVPGRIRTSFSARMSPNASSSSIGLRAMT